MALLLAIYLYVGRNKEAYAIMRALGVPGRKAGGSLIVPLAMLAAVAIPADGFTAGAHIMEKFRCGSTIGGKQPRNSAGNICTGKNSGSKIIFPQKI